MKILVTGANSLLGAHLVLEISARGYTGTGFVRQGARLKALEGTGIEVIRGDITSAADIERASRGCDAIIHAAALSDHSIPSYGKFCEINVNGSLNVINAAIKNGIRKVVYISTANTIGYGNAEKPGTEGDPPLPPYTGSYYVRSKIEAERAIIDKSNGTGVDVTIINPTFILGAYDAKPTSGESVLRGLKNRIIVITPGGKNFVNATDVAKAACNALTEGIHLRKHLVSGTNMDFYSFYRELNRLTGNNKPIVRLPSFIFLLAGYLFQPLFRAGLKTRINLVNMRMICTKNFYKEGRSVTELKVPISPVTEGISESVKWFRENGYC